MVVMLCSPWRSHTPLFHRGCSCRITPAWPCWDNPPKVGLETIKLHHQPRNGFMAGPIHFSTTSPRQKTNHQTLSGSFIYFFFFFFGNILIVIECSTSYSKYRTVTNSWLKSVRENTTWSSDSKPEQKTNRKKKPTPNLHVRWTNRGCGAFQGISSRPCSLHTFET